MHRPAAGRHRRPIGARWRTVALPIALAVTGLALAVPPILGGRLATRVPPPPLVEATFPVGPRAAAGADAPPSPPAPGTIDPVLDAALVLPASPLPAARPAQPVPDPAVGAVVIAPVTPRAPVVGARPAGTLPACEHLDLLTPHHGLEDWDRTLLDTAWRLPAEYAPGDLVDTSRAGLNGGLAVRSFVIPDLRAMAADARAAGAPLRAVSGYRGFGRQATTFDRWVRESGLEVALRTSARPGHSEHQLGTALDITSAGGGDPWYHGNWGATAAGSWVAANAWRYGFVVSYPAGARDRTCYSYEPWHIRYVGRERAAEIQASGRTPREVLWQLQ